ncbi:allophanate hydrolase [Elioraea sp.]|uniref:allophanate hydrolase n=1 Tax=Elioraea sp. TaxID=2185103 RepID=UPI0025C73DEB|nr:allophanate hydrolase [Elioraea sp.]
MSHGGDLSIPALAAAYRAGERPSRVAEAVLAAAAAHGDGAIWIGGPCADRLRAQAAALDARDPASLPLYGIPFAVKDNIDAAGLPTTAGCPAFAYQPAASATVVAALEAAGAMLVGKTNLDQFATGLVGVRSPYGVPRNVLAADRVPGGSSSGSAVAVAAGLVSFALGTDTAGSGRVPAMFNGIVGLKPTKGLVSTWGVVPACRSLDCVSVFATSVADAMAVLAVAAAFDAEDPFARAAPPGWVARGAAGHRPRLGVPAPAQRAFFGRAAPEAAYADALARWAEFADIVTIDFGPFAEAARLLYEGPWVAERTAVVERLLAERPEAIHPVVRGIVVKGTGLSAIETFRAQYSLATLRRAADAVMAGIDALLLPTAPFVPTLAALAAEPVLVNSQLGTYTNFVNLLDLSALAIPAGTDGEGLPFGVTLVGPAFAEGDLAGIAAMFSGEAASPAEAPFPFLDVAVFGAHMRGLPLNKDLVALGARFAREIATASCYRLLALPGQPARPGVVPDAAGAALAGELWRIPAGAVAALLASIPAPLSLGRVRLDDGTETVGFLCTEAAPAGAEDVTRFGGWRAYRASIAGVAAR